MRLPTTFVLAGLLLATTSLARPLAAQTGPGEAPAPPALDPGALARLAKIKIGKAIRIALQARPGVATGAELEATRDGDATVPCFEVMLLGADKTVYEVRVHAVTGKVLANEACTDEADAGEVKAAAALPHAVSLASVAAEAQALLRGTCVVVELVAKTQRAEVTIWNHGRKVEAGFAVADAHLLDARATPAPAKHAAADADEDGDAADAEHDGQHERAGEPKGHERAKDDDDDEHADEDEAHAGAEHRDGKRPQHGVR